MQLIIETFLSLPETAKTLCLPPQIVRRHPERYPPAFLTKGKHRRYRLEDVLTWARQRKRDLVSNEQKI